MVDEILQTRESFSREVEKFVREHEDASYIDALVDYAERHDVEIETIVALLNQKILEELRIEAEDLHYLPKSIRLPI